MVIESLRALILENSAAEAEAIAAGLRSVVPALESQIVASEDDLRASLNARWDAVVSNLSLAPSAIKILRERGVSAPLILVGDEPGAEAAAKLMQQGASGIVCSTNLSGLGAAVADALRRNREIARQQANLEVAEQLAAGLGHELNNLLTVINGYSSLLVRQPQLPAPVKSKLQEIDDAGRRAAQLTGQLLAFARRHVRHPGVLALNGMIAEMEPLLRSLMGPAIELRLRLEPDAGAIYADRGEIEQLIINLTVNARDAVAGSGILEIKAGRSTEGQLEIAVTDQGCGMSPEIRARIFEPFFTTKPVGGGMGMGLAMVHGIVKAIGGRIEVESAVNQGSTFRVLLPPFQPGAGAPETVPETKTAASSPRPSIAAGRERRETILVVEDEDSIRGLIVAALEPLGYQVIPAANAAEAIEACGAHQGSIDLLLTDVRMPDITGIDLARMVEESFPSVRTMFMSGGEGIGLAARAAGDAEFLPKPFTHKTLVAKIRQVLDSSSSPVVLVVDDDPQIRNLLRAVLGEAGYRVEDVCGGRQALERMKRKPPDLLITDLIMPEVEGMETITRIRKIAPDLKIIAMSGSMDSVYLDTAKVLGASATFSKPLQLEALLAAVSGLLQPHALPARQ